MSRNNPTYILLLSFYIFLAITLAIGMVWGNIIFTRNNPIEEEFFIPWLAARTYLEYGDSPYSVPSYQRTQILFYGRLASDAEDPLYLWVSMPGELFYLPFALIKKYELARGIWMTLSELALILTSFLGFKLVYKKYSRLLLFVLSIFFVFWIFNMMDIISSSPIPFGMLALLGSFYALRNQDDELAGILFIIPFLIQGTFLVFFLYLFWWTFDHRRWRILTGFGMSLGILLLLSFLLVPDWVIPSLRGIYWSLIYHPSLSFHNLLGSFWPVAGPRLGWLVTVLLGFILFIEWRGTRNKPFNHFLWTACLTISITPLLGFKIGLDNYSVLSLPLALIFSILVERQPGSKTPSIAIIGLISTWVLGWVLMLITGSQVAIIFPILITTGLLWVKWWMVKPPRTVIETWQ